MEKKRELIEKKFELTAHCDDDGAELNYFDWCWVYDRGEKKVFKHKCKTCGKVYELDKQYPCWEVEKIYIT